MYEHGEGVVQDDKKAARWFYLAAGLVEAQAKLGIMYREGRGVPRDDAKAVKWLIHAAEAGIVEAQANLGDMYKNGEGVEQSYAEALKWIRLRQRRGMSVPKPIWG